MRKEKKKISAQRYTRIKKEVDGQSVVIFFLIECVFRLVRFYRRIREIHAFLNFPSALTRLLTVKIAVNN